MSLQDYAKGVVPTTRRAILVCEGKCIRPKWHWFYESRVEPEITNGGEYGVGFYYGCESCSHMRRWGWEGLKLNVEEEE